MEFVYIVIQTSLPNIDSILLNHIRNCLSRYLNILSSPKRVIVQGFYAHNNLSFSIEIPVLILQSFVIPVL